jgi:hypothetical protein
MTGPWRIGLSARPEDDDDEIVIEILAILHQARAEEQLDRRDFSNEIRKQKRP